MRKKRGYSKPGLRSFDSDTLREGAAMAFLQAGSPLEDGCQTKEDVPVCEKDYCYPNQVIIEVE